MRVMQTYAQTKCVYYVCVCTCFKKKVPRVYLIDRLLILIYRTKDGLLFLRRCLTLLAQCGRRDSKAQGNWNACVDLLFQTKSLVKFLLRFSAGSVSSVSLAKDTATAPDYVGGRLHNVSF